LIELPPADLQHNEISHEIFFRLNTALVEAQARGEAAELGTVRMEAGYKLGRHWAQPDVSITHAGQPAGKYREGAPAIAIEVVSPSNTAETLELKTKLYFEYGAREVWRFYPKTCRVHVNTSDGRGLIVPKDQSVTTPLLPGFTLSVAEVLCP